MKVILNSTDITNDIKKLTIQQGTKNSDALIIKIYYKDGIVDTKVAMPFDLYKTHVILRRDFLKEMVA